MYQARIIYYHSSMLSRLQLLLIALFILLKQKQTSEVRYALKYNNDGACSYTGSWLAHVNLYRRIAFFVDICRAEAASYEIQKTARMQYVFDDADRYAFFVHHLSNYEHVNHMEYGFVQAHNKTAILSLASLRGECGALTTATNSQSAELGDSAVENNHVPPLLKKSKKHSLIGTSLDRPLTDHRNEYIALVPFYGGLPPNISAGAFRTDSLGQGNSRVSLEVKAHQAMATVCSCLRYFGHVFIGVARTEDRYQMKQVILASASSYQWRHRISIVQFQVMKPVHLIFHLLVWGQHYVKIHNCLQFAKPRQSASNASHPVQHSRSLQEKKGWWKGKLKKLTFDESSMSVDAGRIREGGAFEICRAGSIQTSYYALTPLNVSYSSLSSPSPGRRHQRRDDRFQRWSIIGGSKVHPVHTTPIKYVYYTEGDQIVRFSDERVVGEEFSHSLLGISSVLNETMYIGGRRREKARDSSAADYMEGLDDGRSCGMGSFYYTYNYTRTTTESSFTMSNYVFASK